MGQFKCTFCDRHFDTVNGKGLHELREHPVEKSEIAPRCKRPRWTTAEIDMLVETEAQIRLGLKLDATGSESVVLKELISRLLELPHFNRTSDAITGRIKTTKVSHQTAVDIRMQQLAARHVSEVPHSQLSINQLPGGNDFNLTTNDVSSAASTEGCLSASPEACNCYNKVRQAVDDYLIMGPGSITTRLLEGTRENINNFNTRLFFGLRTEGSKPKSPGAPKKVGETGSEKRQLTGRVRDILDKQGPKRCLQFLRSPGASGKCSKATVDLFKKVFEESSDHIDDEPIATKELKSDSHIVHDVITSQEVAVQLKRMNRFTSPGPDAVRVDDLLKAKSADIACLFNIFLLHGDVPSALKVNRTTMIAKSESPGPGDWRPITVASVLDRLFAKILEARLSAAVQLNPHQRGFIRELDGCGDNIVAYGAALRYARLRGKPLVVTSVDLAKAFDSIQHTSIKRALHRLSIDELSIGLIMNLCQGHVTDITYDQGVETVLLRKGVRQGWPLSPLLFLCVIDELLDGLNMADGFTVKNYSLTGRAFADDLILYSNCPTGMQNQVNRVGEWCKRRGMRVNPKKSSVLYLETVPKRKQVRLSACSILIDGEKIPTVSTSFERVLGVCMSHNGRIDHREDVFYNDLELIRKSALRPTQKLRMVRECLVPMIKFRLVYGFANKGTCIRVDKKIRQAVKAFLHLPHCTSNTVFSMPCAKGGLGLPVLEDKVMIEQANLLLKMRSSTSPISQEFATSWIGTSQTCQRLLEGVLTGSEALCDAAKRLAESRQLKSNSPTQLDGWSMFKQAPRMFLDNPEKRNWSGRDVILALKMRSNLLLTRTQMARTICRGSEIRTKCRGCNDQLETQAHILSKCASTQEIRVARHDSVCAYIARRLSEAAAEGVGEIERVEREHTVHINAGEDVNFPVTCSLRPDLMVFCKNRICIIEVSVVYESEDNNSKSLEMIRLRKLDKYRHLRAYVARRYGKEVSVSTLIVGCRGGWIRSNDFVLAGTGVQLTEHDKNCMVERAVRGSLIAYKRFSVMHFNKLVSFVR